MSPLSVVMPVLRLPTHALLRQATIVLQDYKNSSPTLRFGGMRGLHAPAGNLLLVSS